MIQHAGLTLERWSSFTLDQQILMIGNEMNRAGKLTKPDDQERRASAYERALYLTDLTIDAHRRPTLRRELLRWRDLIAILFLERDPRPTDHAKAFRALLLLTPEAAKQIPYVLAGAGAKR
ncbi:MAG TPA: hypothetical protein VET83_02330 [Candidatus Dormibacteraeota bacterium]|nr:hypothetical protein [Candidatus Dormibacteraeota bacterium]